MKNNFIAIGLIFVLFLNCNTKKDLMDQDVAGIKSFQEVFDLFWASMNKNYCYWDIDKSNWKGLHKELKNRFKKLDINNNADQRESVLLFRQLCSNFIDSHFSITFKSNPIFDSTIYPASDRKIKDNKIRKRYDFTFLTEKYLDHSLVSGNYYYKEDNIDKVLFSRFARIKNKFLYLGFNTFALTKALSANHEQTKNVIDSLDFYITNKYQDSEGIIFDLRGNRGGHVVDLNFLFGKLIDKPTDIGYIKYKNGDGCLDYTPWIKATLYPTKKTFRFKKPIVVLVDSYTASVAELFTMAIRCLPNGWIIGEKTWGATGVVSDNLAYHYGSFQIKNVLKVKMSSSQFKYIDNKIYEGVGFPPDIIAKFDLKMYQSGIDNQLETAIKFISDINKNKQLKK